MPHDWGSGGQRLDGGPTKRPHDGDGGSAEKKRYKPMTFFSNPKDQKQTVKAAKAKPKLVNQGNIQTFLIKPIPRSPPKSQSEQKRLDKHNSVGAIKPRSSTTPVASSSKVTLEGDKKPVVKNLLALRNEVQSKDKTKPKPSVPKPGEFIVDLCDSESDSDHVDVRPLPTKRAKMKSIASKRDRPALSQLRWQKDGDLDYDAILAELQNQLDEPDETDEVDELLIPPDHTRYSCKEAIAAYFDGSLWR